MANFATNTPFLLTACNHPDKENNCFSLYSISDKLHLEFDEPFLHKKLFIGSQHGWLILLDQHWEPTLFNPLTGESMSLPSITTLPRVRPRYSVNSNMVSYFCLTDFRPEHEFLDCEFEICQTFLAFRKVLVSSNPSISSSNFFAAALFYPSCTRLAITRPGENRWNLLSEKQFYRDIMFHQDRKLICLTGEGAIHEVELKNDNIVITEMSAPFIKDNTTLNMYLAEDSAGRVLVIVRHMDFISEELFLSTDIKVFRLIDDNEGESKWERVKSLDGQAIFVGSNAPISIAKQDLHGTIKADTIYFTDEWWDFIGPDEESSSRVRDICAYNLISNSIEPCCPYEHRQCPWPLPIWTHLSNPTSMLN